eukprot:GHVU01082738.1.p2 GENE.GHVU01082738.1~~GHVU01082738.1.p2  ORF type:complete len:103 (-),score=40.75 GHVU01082738.1:731-1039(-)
MAAASEAAAPRGEGPLLPVGREAGVQRVELEEAQAAAETVQLRSPLQSQQGVAKQQPTTGIQSDCLVVRRPARRGEEQEEQEEEKKEEEKERRHKPNELSNE